MKSRTVLGLLFCLLSSLPAPCAAEPAELTVLTFNVLVEFSEKPGVPKWKDRKALCAQVIRDSQADLIGLQEPTPGQVKFFLAEAPGYEAVSHKGYPDATLLYKKDRFAELERGEWWLSPTPDKVSVGFGNALPRIVVWALLKDKSSGQELYALNTHFDNSMPSQVRMAKLCQDKLQPLAETKRPMIFMGDFNTTQKRGDYPTLTSNGWQDSYAVSDKASSGGRDDNVPTMVDGEGRIDHIFYHGPGLTPKAWQRVESPDPSKMLSDHFPVLARFRME